MLTHPRRLIFLSLLFIVEFAIPANLKGKRNDQTKFRTGFQLNDVIGHKPKKTLSTILNVFTQKYYCRERNVNVSSVVNADDKSASGFSTNKGHFKFSPFCFPNDWPVAIYVASSVDEKNIESNYDNFSLQDLIIRHLEITEQNRIIYENCGINMVVAIDLYPTTKYGHPVIIYYAFDGDRNISLCHQKHSICVKGQCIKEVTMDDHVCMDGTSSSSSNTTRNYYENEFTSANVKKGQIKRFLNCQPSFLPYVFLKSDHDEKKQVLRCLKQKELPSEFSKAVRISESVCRIEEFLSVSSVDLSSSSPPSLLQQTTSSSPEYACNIFKICDQALLISGGWNRRSVTLRDFKMTDRFRRMLLNYGFPARNIRLFTSFDSSSRSSERSNLTNHPVMLPGKNKFAIRKLLKYLCSEQHCVDSLVVYLNNPTLKNGDMLLWDLDENGEANPEKEVYSLSELSDDLSNCRARQVVIVADQSYSNKLVELFNTRGRLHHYTAVYSSGRGFVVPKRESRKRNSHINQNLKTQSIGTQTIVERLSKERRKEKMKHQNQHRNWIGSFTGAWLSFNHTRRCHGEVFQLIRRRMGRHFPLKKFVGSFANDQTIFGAPCTINPPLSREELSLAYYGCQRLPWSIRAHIDRSRRLNSDDNNNSSNAGKEIRGEKRMSIL